MDQWATLSLAQLVLQGLQIPELYYLCSIRCYFVMLIIIVKKINNLRITELFFFLVSNFLVNKKGEGIIFLKILFLLS